MKNNKKNLIYESKQFSSPFTSREMLNSSREINCNSNILNLVSTENNTLITSMLATKETEVAPILYSPAQEKKVTFEIISN